MTSITSAQGSSGSPRAMMDARISAASISAADKTALSSALDSIDSALSSDKASGSKPTSGIKDRVDGLIDQQVKDGKLTDDQAKELKEIFAQGPQGAGGPGGPGGAGGPPPPPPSDSSSDSSSETSATDDQQDDQMEALLAFLEQLRSQDSDSTYNPNATGSTGSSSGMLVDTKI